MFLVILLLVRLSLCLSVSLPQSVSLFLSELPLRDSHTCPHTYKHKSLTHGPHPGPSEPWLVLKLENDATGATTKYKRWILQM